MNLYSNMIVFIYVDTRYHIYIYTQILPVSCIYLMSSSCPKISKGREKRLIGHVSLVTAGMSSDRTHWNRIMNLKIDFTVQESHTPRKLT